MKKSSLDALIAFLREPEPGHWWRLPNAAFGYPDSVIDMVML
jgi:hypothetical protein